MKTMTVGEFKTHFSEVVDLILKGEGVQVTYGRKKEVIGKFMPTVKAKKPRPIGIFDNTPGYHMASDFCETTYEDFPIDDLK